MPYYIDQIQDKFLDLEWNRVYDFLELLISIKNENPNSKNNFISRLNQIFIDEKVPCKIIDCLVVPLISGEESEELMRAMASKYDVVNNHIKKALEYYKKRPVADYKNSIKESISSVEALARIVLNRPSATLGEMSQQLNIHPSLKEAIKKLYGWTSDEGGIRHAEKENETLTADEAEARFMLVQCSALVNYIISKYE
jgi:hypothetical protein